MKLFITSLLALSLCLNSFGQSPIIPGEFIVQLKLGQSPETFAKDLESLNLNSTFFIAQNLSKRFNIWLFKGPQGNEFQLAKTLQTLNSVAVAQVNHAVQLRTTLPNDPQFSQQWALQNTGQSGGNVGADIDATLAWDITTGGTTSTGDTIVVAVIDGGFQLDHPDLNKNFFVNHNEIPGNGIDDDQNGYIDDVSGWNAYDDDGIIPLDQHGTHVSGIIGAIGDNNVGVSGINWNVKILPIAGSSGNEATVVAAYAYVAEMRMQYDESNGVKGAFVVSTNSSFGVDQGDPTEFPIWCSFYDTLGNLGILSAGATANSNFNIDNTGDIPTACASEFLIAVTNSTRTDTKYNSSGYGVNSIDIAAPGTTVYSTITNSNYANLTGTSMATPYVAGSIALMYSAACELLINDYHASPASIALIMKQYLYTGAEQIPSLDGLVNSQRRLNVNGAIQQVLTYICNAEAPPVANFSAPSPSGCPGLTLQFNNTSSSNATSYLWEFAGGNPSSSTLEDPIVTYNNFGAFNVKLIASNNYGSDTTEFNNYVNIDNTGIRTLHSEKFESGTIESIGYQVVNEDGLNTWEITTTAGNISSSKSIGINYYNNEANIGQRDFLISPPVALNQTSNNTLNVKYAHRRRTGSIADSLIISITTDQGANWNRLIALGGGSNSSNPLATSTLLNSNFIPTSSSDWCSGTQCLVLDISAFDGSTEVQFRFEGYNSGGNNIYLDDISVQGQCTAPIVAPVDAEFAANSQACLGQALQFNNLSNNATSYSWSFPGGTPSSSTSINPSVTYAELGTFPVTLIASNSQFADTLEQVAYISVAEVPVTPIIVVSGNTFSTNSTGNLQWYFNGQVINGATTNSIEAINPGSYSVVVTNANGCSTSSNPEVIVGLDGAITDLNGIEVFPNPAEDFIIIRNNINEIINYRLFDQLGRLQFDGKVSNLDQINLAELSSGIYILQIRSSKSIKNIQLIHP
jgi:PKD repeat protein